MSEHKLMDALIASTKETIVWLARGAQAVFPGWAAHIFWDDRLILVSTPGAAGSASEQLRSDRRIGARIELAENERIAGPSRRLRRWPVVIAAPPDAVLHLKVALPENAISRLDAIAPLNLASWTSFSPDEVAYAVTVEPEATNGAGTIAIDLVPLSALTRMVDALKNMRITPIGVWLPDGRLLRLPGQRVGAWRKNRLIDSTLLATAVLGLALVIRMEIGHAVSDREATLARLSSLSREAREIPVLLQEIAKETSALETARVRIEARRSLTDDLVALKQFVPEGTTVVSLRLEGGELELGLVSKHTEQHMREQVSKEAGLNLRLTAQSNNNMNSYVLSGELPESAP